MGHPDPSKICEHYLTSDEAANFIELTDQRITFSPPKELGTGSKTPNAETNFETQDTSRARRIPEADCTN